MNVLIIFETTEGQTRKIARFMADTVGKLGHSVDLVDAGGMDPVSFDGVGPVILAAPVHQRRHPKSFEALIAAQKDELANHKTLMVSVSLSAAFEGGLSDARDYLLEMTMRTGFTPGEEAFVGGALSVSKYDYFAMQVIKHVVLRGRDFDTSVGEHEFTDWDALKDTVSTFVQSA